MAHEIRVRIRSSGRVGTGFLCRRDCSGSRVAMNALVLRGKVKADAGTALCGGGERSMSSDKEEPDRSLGRRADDAHGHEARKEVAAARITQLKLMLGGMTFIAAVSIVCLVVVLGQASQDTKAASKAEVAAQQAASAYNVANAIQQSRIASCKDTNARHVAVTSAIIGLYKHDRPIVHLAAEIGRKRVIITFNAAVSNETTKEAELGVVDALAPYRKSCRKFVEGGG